MKITIILLSLTILFLSCGKKQQPEPTKPDTTNKSTNQITSDTIKKELTTKSDTVKPSESKLFKGYYSYFADVSVFIECGKKDNLYTDGPDNATLEKEYLKVRKETNEKIYAEVEGYLSNQVNEEKGVNETVLIVTKFIKADREKKCP